MTFNNMDSGVVHNFALYTDSSAKTRIFVGDFVTGPKTVTYTFDAPSTPGTYFFRCDIHPTVMFGNFCGDVKGPGKKYQYSIYHGHVCTKGHL